ILNPQEESSLNISACSNVGSPAESNFEWFVGSAGDPSVCYAAEVVQESTASTFSNAIWTAPSCPTSEVTCRPSIRVSGLGGSIVYSTNITVRPAGEIEVFIHDITEGEAQTSSAPLFSGETTLGLSGEL